MAFVFGPVPSRRLGRSLGIDPVPPKTCNWNCVYCQIGRTTPLQTERREFFPRDEILSEARRVLSAHPAGAIDWVTFVGSGETTLYRELGWLVREVRKLSSLPIAVITNGSLLYRRDVREELTAADAVLPSLDAGNPGLYRRINRPSPELTFERLVEGLIAFREEYRGQLWLEVMLIKGLNDSEEALVEIAGILRRVRPDCVHLAVPSRPPSEPWVEIPEDAGMRRAVSVLGDVARLITPSGAEYDLSAHADVTDAVAQIVARHPMGEEELRRTLARWSGREVDDALRLLAQSGRVQVVERQGKRFWCAAGYRYPEEKG
jgi:wyosine [tRNA(Phe)-imidazoG37] synthetase (radical SAM superfamily)